MEGVASIRRMGEEVMRRAQRGRECLGGGRSASVGMLDARWGPEERARFKAPSPLRHRSTWAVYAEPTS